MGAYAELVSVGLDAGLSVEEAGALAAASMRGHGQDADGAHGSQMLARAALLSERLGTPLADATRATATAARARAASMRRRQSLLAGPRASMAVVTLLPLAGPGVCVLLGLPVSEVYARPAAAASLVVGVLLTGTGWWVSRRLVRAGARPRALTRPVRVASPAGAAGHARAQGPSRRLGSEGP